MRGLQPFSQRHNHLHPLLELLSRVHNTRVRLVPFHRTGHGPTSRHTIIARCTSAMLSPFKHAVTKSLAAWHRFITRRANGVVQSCCTCRSMSPLSSGAIHLDEPR